MKKTAVFFGSFDPVTKGHIWVAQRTIEDGHADNLIVCVKKSLAKSRFLTLENACALFSLALPASIRKQVSCAIMPTLSFSCPPEASLLIRGRRSQKEFLFESSVRGLLFIDAATNLCAFPPPLKWITSNPPDGPTTSTKARNILFSLFAQKDDLVRTIPDQVADILLSARKASCLRPEDSQSVQAFNVAVAERLAQAGQNPSSTALWPSAIAASSRKGPKGCFP